MFAMMVVDNERIIDIPLHDTYFVFRLSHLDAVLGLFFLFWSLIYWKLKLNPLLGCFHFVATILPIMFWVWCMTFSDFYIVVPPKQSIPIVFFMVASYLFWAGQLVFLINLVYKALKSN
jgi:heme/copper-type cytochrome/quinol oxidase subunit 1